MNPEQMPNELGFSNEVKEVLNDLIAKFKGDERFSVLLEKMKQEPVFDNLINEVIIRFIAGGKANMDESLRLMKRSMEIYDKGSKTEVYNEAIMDELIKESKTGKDLEKEYTDQNGVVEEFKKAA